MQVHRRIRRRVLFFAAVLLMLLVMEPAALEVLGGGLALLLVLCLTALVGLAVNHVSAHLLNTAARDEMAAEENARNERLNTLRSQMAQMDQTLRDLRDLRLPEAETTRARWAEIDLEEALGRTRGQIRDEQAALALLHTTRWLQQLEPLLRMPYFLSPAWLRIDPTFDPVRKNPRFQRLLSQATP